MALATGRATGCRSPSESARTAPAGAPAAWPHTRSLRPWLRVSAAGPGPIPKPAGGGPPTQIVIRDLRSYRMACSSPFLHCRRAPESAALPRPLKYRRKGIPRPPGRGREGGRVYPSHHPSQTIIHRNTGGRGSPDRLSLSPSRLRFSTPILDMYARAQESVRARGRAHTWTRTQAAGWSRGALRALYLAV